MMTPDQALGLALVIADQRVQIEQLHQQIDNLQDALTAAQQANATTN